MWGQPGCCGSPREGPLTPGGETGYLQSARAEWPLQKSSLGAAGRGRRESAREKVGGRGADIKTGDPGGSSELTQAHDQQACIWQGGWASVNTPQTALGSSLQPGRKGRTHVPHSQSPRRTGCSPRSTHKSGHRPAGHCRKPWKSAHGTILFPEDPDCPRRGRGTPGDSGTQAAPWFPTLQVQTS